MEKQLRMIAAEIVFESTLSKPAKLQLLNFIKEDATDCQVKALILDGKITKLDEQTEEIVNDRFNARFELSEASEMDLIGPVLGGTAALIGARAALGAYRIYRTYLSKAGRACAGRSGQDRQRCIGDYKTKGKIAALKAALSKCNQSKDPEKCKTKTTTKIKKLEGTMSV